MHHKFVYGYTVHILRNKITTELVRRLCKESYPNDVGEFNFCYIGILLIYLY